ncbi:hypothetical protein SCARR_05156 [Pontiella sulfatireligans]|uniref:CBM-cenC domain-containing protein n=2 Tax=Pontiella sulfatireligans TaxID=2750658 RepID=A0A6C2UVB8_9BACT|nr:hypothetical protein SCARR_05156 [Pontiella sulfatireligans]
MGAVFALMAATHGAVHTVTINTHDVQNALADPGFEALIGTEPNAGSAPWFTTGEEASSNFKGSTNRAYAGSQSAVFADYGDKGAMVQNLDLQVDAGKYYHVSVWMLTDDPSISSAHTNTPAINATIYTSSSLDGAYSYRAGFFWSRTTSADGAWEKMEGTLTGTSLSAYAGEYIQIRIIKANEKTTHRIFVDNAVLIESDSPDAPKTVSPYLVGANIVYSKDEGRIWEEEHRVDVLNRAGMNNLRYPGGHVVSYWDWEFPYHGAYQNFWDPSYSLTPSESNALFQANQNRLSLDEHLDLCRETGAAPLIGINMFQGYKFNRDQDSIDKAVRLVNYCKNKITGPRYYYLDNEVGHQPTENNHVPIDAYLPLIPDYSTAIKAADPQGKIAVNIMTWSRVEEIVRDYGDYVDLYDQHWYYSNRVWGQFWPDDWRGDVNMGVYTSRLNQFNGWIDTYNKPHLKMGFLEWNIGPSTGADGSTPGTVFYQGLVQADILMHMIRFDVHMASIWPLTWDDNFRNLIDGPDHTVSPTLYIHRALSKAAGGTRLNLSEPDTGGLLRSLAVKSADEAFIDCYFLNKSTEAIDLAIELPVPIVETVLMNFAQGAGSNDVNVSEQRYAGDSAPLQFSLADTSFTHIRYRISGSPTSYELFADDFESSVDVGNVASAPYPVGSWHHQGSADWMVEGSGTSVDISEFNGISGNELRIGWGYDEVVTLYSTAVPIHTSQTYTFRGRWEIGSVVDSPRGFIAGFAEFSAEDGSLIQRLTPDSLVFGNTNAPVAGETGTFEVMLESAELVAAGTTPGNLIGLFLHHDDGGDLYDDSNVLKNDVYYIDNVSLEVSGAITMLDQWMVDHKVAGALADSDGDGLDNLAEFALGGNPTNPATQGFAPIFSVVSNGFNYVYPRRLNSDLTYSLETTDNLRSNNWTAATYGELPATDEHSPGFEAVSNTVSLSGTNAFLRLRIEG